MPDRSRTERLAPPAVALLATVAMLFAAATATAAPMWLAPTMLRPTSDDHGPGYGAHDVAAAADGTVVATSVMSQDRRTPPTDVLAQVRPPGGGFGAAQLLARGLPEHYVTDPKLAMDAAGDAIVAWFEGGDDQTMHLRTAYMPAGTGTFEPTQDMAAPGADSNEGVGVAIAGGTAIVVWTHDPTETTAVVSAAVRPAGATSSFGAPTDISAPGGRAETPQVAMAPDGIAYALWRSDQGSSPQQVHASVRAAGGAFGAPVDLYTAATADEMVGPPTVAVAPDGRATVMWTTRLHSFGTVLALQSGPTGDFGSLVPDVVSDPSEDAESFQLAVDDRGTALALYASPQGIVATTRPAGGVFSDTPETVTTSKNTGLPRVAFAPDGTAVVVWLTVRRMVSETEVLQATEKPPGGKFGAVVDLDSAAGPAADLSTPPPPAVDGEGNATVLYGARRMDDGPFGPAPGTDWTVTLDAGAPTLSASVPATATAGAPVTVSATATDRWTATKVTWSFGDGSPDATGTTVTHAFQKAGSYVVSATATDAVGNTTTRTASITVAAAAPAQRPKPAALAAGSVQARWAVGRATTTVKHLTIPSVHSHVKVVVSCVGGTRRGCRFTRRTIHTKKAGTVSLTTYFRAVGKHKVVSHLRAGAVVKVVVTAAGRRGRTYRAVVRTRHAPKAARSCLAVGSTTRATAC
ncbi:MAG TPA: PKD domain-containing protein [Baekduia sp.]|jgi:hypothetical protein